MKDASKYQLHRELAREEFRCSQSAQNPYLRDAAQYFYGSDLFNSLKTNDDVLQSGPDVAARMNELAAMTQFVDIKRLALKLRDLAKQAVQESHDAGYGTPQPSPLPDLTRLPLALIPLER